MKIAIFTVVEASSRELASSARSAGHAVRMGHFTSEEDKAWLQKSDALIVRFSNRTYDKACAIARWYQVHNAQGVLIPTEQAIRASADKYEAYKTLHTHGVATPQTYVVYGADDIARQDLPQKLPLIIKPRTENRGKGINIARTESELREYCLTLLETYGSCVVQDFIVEAGGKDVRAFVIGDTVVAAMERSAPDGSDIANLSQGGTARAIQLDEQSERLALAASRACGTNVAGVDLLQTSNGMTVLEVNASPGVKVAQVTGIDVCGLIIQYIAYERAKND